MHDDDALTILRRALTGGGDHVVFVAPHPRVAMIGAGIAMSRVMRATVVHVTSGEREDEARDALELAGVQSVIWLKVPGHEVKEQLEAVTAQLCDVLDRLRPDVVVTCGYGAGQPEFDCTALAVSVASRVPVAEMTLHSVPALIDDEVAALTESPFLHMELSAYEQALKRSIVDCFGTERATLSQLPIGSERFRNAPVYDFV
jgi:N-acetylglucosamine malate deacetylase 2